MTYSLQLVPVQLLVTCQGVLVCFLPGNQPGEVEEPAPLNQQPPPRDREGEEEDSDGDHQPPNNLDRDEGDSGDGNEVSVSVAFKLCGPGQ